MKGLFTKSTRVCQLIRHGSNPNVFNPNGVRVVTSNFDHDYAEQAEVEKRSAAGFNGGYYNVVTDGTAEGQFEGPLFYNLMDDEVLPYLIAKCKAQNDVTNAGIRTRTYYFEQTDRPDRDFFAVEEGRVNGPFLRGGFGMFTSFKLSSKAGKNGQTRATLPFVTQWPKEIEGAMTGGEPGNTKFRIVANDVSGNLTLQLTVEGSAPNTTILAPGDNEATTKGKIEAALGVGVVADVDGTIIAGAGATANKTEVLPAVRTNLNTSTALCPTNGKIYIFGGITTGNAFANNILEYNPATGAFSTKTAVLPAAVYGASCCWSAAINKFVIVGGHDGGQDGQTTTISVYDPFSDTLTVRPEVLIAKRSNAMLEEVAGKVYILGGSSANGVSTNTIWEYDPTTFAITVKVNLPSTRENAGSAVVGGLIYILGGSSGATVSTTTIYRYNPVANSITTMGAVIPNNGRSSATTGTDGTHIWILGGNNGTNATNTIYEYVPSTDSLTTRAETLPTARQAAGGDYKDGIIYLLGGDIASNASNVVSNFTISATPSAGQIDVEIQGSLENTHVIASKSAGHAGYVVSTEQVGGSGINSSLVDPKPILPGHIKLYRADTLAGLDNPSAFVGVVEEWELEQPNGPEPSYFHNNENSADPLTYSAHKEPEQLTYTLSVTIPTDLPGGHCSTLRDGARQYVSKPQFWRIEMLSPEAGYSQRVEFYGSIDRNIPLVFNDNVEERQLFFDLLVNRGGSWNFRWVSKVPV
jgi:hypothetical protein